MIQAQTAPALARRWSMHAPLRRLAAAVLFLALACTGDVGGPERPKIGIPELSAVSAPPWISPATEAIMETSSNSAGDSGGRIEGSRAASIDLPEPGEPIMRR